MAIISEIGKKSLKVRIMIWSFYGILLLGALTMLYPFMLMISGSTKSSIDTPDSKIIPRFLVNEEALYQKDIEAFFNESLKMMQATYLTAANSFKSVNMPEKINEDLVMEWSEFLKEKKIPHYFYSLAYISSPVSKKVIPLSLRRFKSGLFQKYNGNIDEMNERLGTDFASWNSFLVFPEYCLPRRNRPGSSKFDLEYIKFKGEQPLENRFYLSSPGFFKTAYLFSQYGKNIENYNKEHKTNYKSWSEITLTRRFPVHGTKLEQQDWNVFVRSILNLYWIRADKKAEPLYQKFLKAKYSDIGKLNKNYNTSYKSFSEITIIKEIPSSSIKVSDWENFIQGWQDDGTNILHILPANMIYLTCVDFIFCDYLKQKYSSLHDLNTALNTDFRAWNEIHPPQQEFHYKIFRNRTRTLKWEYVKRNFLSVAEYIILHGRGVLTSFLYCSLAILFALVVNPLAAYALSRYKLPSAYKILLFLMLTMAFPPMVTQIPVFLMLREFNLLNTFFALILPGMANGYSIFLLKGFFDSLPPELYESAELDGAGELRIFWQITMSLSKPILAVIALNAFTLAYSNFMMALLVCQDQKMWTLMPWLYQLQQDGCQGIVFSSLIIAAVPTFLIFILCQNIIMRGIVVPVEK